MRDHKTILVKVLLFVVLCIPTQVFGEDKVFDIYKQRLEFLTKNDAVIAQNIANADTPKYKPKALRKKKRSEYNNIKLKTTNPMHIYAEEESSKYALTQAEIIEIKPSGNAVTIENELLKKSQNSLQLNQVANLYNKHKSMMKYAITGHIK